MHFRGGFVLYQSPSHPVCKRYRQHIPCRKQHPQNMRILFLNMLPPIMGITSGQDKLFCRAWIWIYLQITPEPLGPPQVCHCSALTQRTESCLQWLTGREKAKWKGKKHLPKTSPHLGAIWEMIWVSSAPVPCRVGKVQGVEAGTVQTLIDDRLTTHQTG